MTDENAAADAADPAEQESADGPTGSDDAEDESLVDRVAEHDQDLAEAVEERIAALEDEVETLESDLADREERVEELTERLQRTQADFQNYKKRAEEREEELRERATEELIEELLEVRDNLSRALEQEEGTDIREGVEATLRSFDRVLESENVEPIEPEPGSEVDPSRHQVMLTVESEEPEGTVAEVYQPGYEMGDEVLREARVTVSEGN